ncbi:hypothetical protein Tco_0886294 [Tanacetum coccineum]
MSQEKEAQIKLYKTREDKELDKVIALENKVKVLDDIVYKTGQFVQTINMLNRCYNDNLTLMLAPDSDETIRLDKERRSKLSDLIRPFDYDQLNNLYDLFRFHNGEEVPAETTLVIPTTSVSRPQPKRNHLEDRTSNVNFVCVTCGKYVLNDNHDLCVLHYINGVHSRTRQPMTVPISTREPKQTVNQSVATSSKKTVATDSTVKKFRNTTRKLYEQVSKTCSWWYPKYTPPGYNWKPKSQIGNVNPNVSMPLGNASRTANILEHKTPRCSMFQLLSHRLITNSFCSSSR